MSGQFPTTHSQNLSESFLEQAVCNRSYSSLPTSSVTPTYSSSFSSTWSNLAVSSEEKDDNNGSCLSENSCLEPDTLMKLLNDSDEPSDFFHHPPETATTPTYSNQMTNTSKSSTKNNPSIKTNTLTNSSIRSAVENTNNNNHQNSEEKNLNSTENTCSGKLEGKTDSTTSTHSMKTLSSSEVKVNPSCSSNSDSKLASEKLVSSSPTMMGGSNFNNLTSKPNIMNKPRAPNQMATSPPRKVLVPLKEPSPKTTMSKPDSAVNSGGNSCIKLTSNSVKPETNGAHTPKSAPIKKQEISPNPDNVESLLESMFQFSTSAAAETVKTATDPTPSNRSLRAESVEKILKSPSPPSFNGECNIEALMKSPTKPSVEIKSEPTDEKSANKENADTPRVNGQTSTDKPIIIFNEVESELEKMFAGIVVPEASIKTEPIVKAESSKKIKSGRRSSDNSILSSCSSSDNKKTKKGLKRLQDDRKDVKPTSKKFKMDKETSNDSFYSKLRGPVIHIEGPKENPTSYTIINCRTKPEDEETQDSKSSLKKKGPQRTGSSKVTEGALETIKTTDELWICFFCKKGPNVPGVGGYPLGDLFGPYHIKDKNAGDQKVKKKKKLTDAKIAMLRNEGMLYIPSRGDFEYWLHENCCVWASGVYLVGSQLRGLDDAVWAACSTKCDHCGVSGASIGCAARHCKSTTHYSCALHTHWHLNQETFITRCNRHETPLLFSPTVSCS